MQASQRNIQPLIDGQLQYVVPLFQRPYSWDKKQWQTLWEDIVMLCEEEPTKHHFIGSIVTMQTVSVPEGVPKYLLIDGQQRLTTLFIILAVLRDNALHEQHAAELNEVYLINRYKPDFDRYKLLPTQVDRDHFINLIERRPVDTNHLITRAYQFFESHIRRTPHNIDRLKRVITSQLSVVSIVLDPNDNPYLVFESLNAKGRPLTQADLIRNFFFMRIHPNEQAKIYQDYWQPMEARLGEMLTEYIRHYLMSFGLVVKENEIYFTLKDRVANSDAIPALAELSANSQYYQRFLNPQEEPHPAIREALKRLRLMEITTIYPFLLSCYADYANGGLVVGDLLQILADVENFLVRRFVCNIPSNGINKIAPVLYEQSQSESTANQIPFVTAVRKVLSKRDYPKDTQFLEGLKANRLYGGGDRRSQTRVILEGLERSFGHKERVDFSHLSIEHVMPQTLIPWWESHLGEEWETTHEIHLHTLGNLTLTAYNSELSNDSFPEKQRRLQESHLELNRYFSDVTEWNDLEIQKRAELLAQKALSIWPYFGDSTAVAFVDEDFVTNKTPISITILGERHTVNSWRDVLKITVDVLSKLEPIGFEGLVEKHPSFLSYDSTRFRTKYQMANGVYLQVNLPARYVYRICKRLIVDIGLSEKDWQIEID
ncbi:MAG: DUF262 domain-containing protein [Phototrophicaceae bacterium]|jgi:uncharacterized protein with ParB-like and HNH nuclease domain